MKVSVGQLSCRVLLILASVALLVLAVWLAGAEDAFVRIMAFPFWTTVSIMALVLANLFLVGLRLWRGLAHFGVCLPLKVVSHASLSGHIAGLFVISLFGQVMGRQAVLHAYGVRPVVTSAFILYERVVLLLVNGTLAALGSSYLFGQRVIAEFIGDLSLTEIMVTGGVGVGLSLWFGRSQIERRLSMQALTTANLVRAFEIAGVSLIGQLLILTCFVLGILAVASHIDIASAFAAAAVISFAASLPVTVNGWGVREVAAASVLGMFGVPAADAVAISVIVGLCSTLVILITAAPFILNNESLVSTHGPRAWDHSPPSSISPTREFEQSAAWVLGFATSVLIFFQAHVTLPGGLINLNLADPLAVLAFAAVSLHGLLARQPPAWRLRRFNLALMAISVLLLAGFVRGWLEIGITQWALGARLTGWLVLLGYLSAGYLIVTSAGARGLRRVVETLISVATAIVIVQVCLRLMFSFGIGSGLTLTPNFEGFAGNRNAFAFQLLTSTAACLGYASVYAKHGRRHQRPKKLIFGSVLLGIVLAGIVWSGSRAGIGIGLLLLVGVWLSRSVDRRFLAWSVSVAVILWVGVWLAHSTISVQSIISVQSTIGGSVSDKEHWRSLVHGFELWRESPLIGVGLGVFFSKSTDWFGHPVVIHSTPLWILTEFGLLGMVVVGGVFVMLARFALAARSCSPAARSLLLLLTTFGMFSLVHEVFYQRMFWLILGALLAKPFVHRHPAGATR